MSDDTFAFVQPMDVRYRDLDPMGHVNNAVYASYMEQARIDYFDDVLSVDLAGISSVLAHLELDYRRPITGEEDVEVALRTARVGESSIAQEYEIRADDEVAATGESVQVYVDPETHESRPFPQEWREQFYEFEPALAVADA